MQKYFSQCWNYIFIINDKNDIDNSLVTVEVRGGKVVQARQRFNESVTENQQKALNKYEEYLSSVKGNKNEEA